MKYQLVLQWPASAITDYDAVIEIENLLIEKLTDANDVDGHDMGSGESNIFIHTDDPLSALNELKAILADNRCWGNVSIAFREISKTDYTVLWPTDGSKFKVK
jgi:hypothetical protein